MFAALKIGLLNGFETQTFFSVRKQTSYLHNHSEHSSGCKGCSRDSRMGVNDKSVMLDFAASSGIAAGEVLAHDSSHSMQNSRDNEYL